ncbi:helix-turn-helix transcriptional regulator [Paenibacillus tarimensis]
MSNIHRIQWFDQQIRESGYPNSRLLAQQFEISVRQAQRDIEYMIVSLRAPLLYIAKYRGYCYEDKTYVLPLLYMTEEEKRVLQYLVFRYSQYNYDNAAPVRRVGQLLARFTDGEEDGSAGRLPVFNASPRLMQNVQLLSYAIQNRLTVQAVYKDGNEETALLLCPLKLVAQYNTDYLITYCKQQNKERMLRLDCIGLVSLTDTTFEPNLAERVKWEDDTVPVRKPFTAKVALPKPLEGKAWNGFAIRAVQGLNYEIEFYDADLFMQHLLAAEWAELLSPGWLRLKLQNKCRRILERLNDEGAESMDQAPNG